MVMTDGVHGTALGPVEMLVLNVILISFSFFLLCRPTQSAKREILVLTSITTAAAASRILLEPFPNVQPLTVMCLVMGASLGARRGMAFAVMATMLSNIVLSHGLWTFFQATGWAAVAFAGSRLGLVIRVTGCHEETPLFSRVRFSTIRLVGFTICSFKPSNGF